MKRCPKCYFGFVNFHQVCDFDGAELVDDPQTLPVSPAVSALAAASQSPFLRLAKSPVLYTVLALAGVLSSLLLLVYYDAARQPNSIAESPASRDSVVSVFPQVKLPAPIKTQTPSARANEGSTGSVSDRVTSRFASPLRARLRSSAGIRNRQSRPGTALQRPPRNKALPKESQETALQRESEENGNRKESKLTATLKSTWRILKRPFKF